MEKVKVINMDSWHFWLYERGMGCSVRKWQTVHRVNRCTYLKKIFKGVLEVAVITMLTIMGIGIISLAPFGIFQLFMAHPVGMMYFAVVLVGIGLSVPIIAAKRKLWKQVEKVDTYMSFKELVLGYFKDIEKGLCPMLTAKRSKNYQKRSFC